MKIVPRFGLQALFIMVFCIAVGLATNPCSWSALRPAVETAMVIGLLQQVRTVSRVGDLSADFRFAAAYAIFWRIVVASAMAFFVVVNLGGWHEAVRDDLFLYERATAIFDLLPIIVLASSIRRWTSSDDQVPAGNGRRLLFGLIAIVMTSFIVIDGNLVQYLVHKATASMEASIPPRFQRPDVYPIHADEGFRSFWLASAAAFSVAVGAVCLLVAAKCCASMTIRRLLSATFVACLLAQLFYCCWFYTVEFHRISPEFAGVGLAANWADWLEATAIALIMVTAGAYGVSLSRNKAATVLANLAEDLDRTAFYETVPCLVLMAVAAGTTLVRTAVELATAILYPMFPSMPSWLYPGMLCNPTVLLILAQTLLVFQLCWIRWQRRGQESPWEMPVLPARVFVAHWMALALATIIGLPTLKAFGFMFWLGPFNFSGI